MYKLEMHLHTIGRSECAQEEPKLIAQIYDRERYDGIICTNHYIRVLFDTYYKKGSFKANCEFYLDGYYDLKKECEKYGIDVFLGMEMLIDSLSYYNPNPPYAEMLIYGIEPQLLLDNCERLFPMTQEELYGFCEENGLLLFQSHPFRRNITQLNPKLLHGAEVYNGHPGHCSRNDLAEKFARENNLIESAGSDFHFKGGEGSGVYLKESVKTNAQLVDELKKRRHEIFKRQENFSSNQ